MHNSILRLLIFRFIVNPSRSVALYSCYENVPNKNVRRVCNNPKFYQKIQIATLALNHP